LLYGAEVLIPSKTIVGKMQKFWNRVARWVTNAFYATNTIVLSAEACLAPISLYLEQMRKMTVIRLVTALPENNIATAMLPMTFPTKDDFRVETNRRLAFDMNKGGMRPKSWTSNATTTQQVRLPMDQVAAIAATLFPESKIPVKPSRLAQVTPQDAELCAKTKDDLRKNIWTKWVNEDYPEYYRYRPPFRDCWSFMTFQKFQAGRIHQMRAHKSYLNAHTDWSNQDRDHTCSRCGNAPKTMDHIMICPTLASTRE